MATPVNTLVDSVTRLISEVYITPVIEYLVKEKQVTVTHQEILSVLNLPVVAPHVHVVPPMFHQQMAMAPSVPLPLKTTIDPSLMNYQAPPSASKDAAGGKRSKDDGPRCEYAISRGPRAKNGDLCGKKAVPGTNRCSQCATKGQSKTEKTTSGGGKKLPISVAPPTFPIAPPTFPVTSVVAPGGDKDLMKLPNGHFRDTINDFFVVELGGEHVVYGVMIDRSDYSGTNLRGLNDHEVQIATSRGLQVHDKARATQVTVAPPQFKIPEATLPIQFQAGNPIGLPTQIVSQLPPVPVAAPQVSSTVPNLQDLLDKMRVNTVAPTA